jgi:hypothetical protein
LTIVCYECAGLYRRERRENTLVNAMEVLTKALDHMAEVMLDG